MSYMFVVLEIHVVAEQMDYFQPFALPLINTVCNK